MDIERRTRKSLLENELARAISESRWRDGDYLPTVRELAILYGVAVNTVRRSIEGLRARA